MAALGRACVPSEQWEAVSLAVHRLEGAGDGGGGLLSGPGRSTSDSI